MCLQGSYDHSSPSPGVRRNKSTYGEVEIRDGMVGRDDEIRSRGVKGGLSKNKNNVG